MKKPPVWISDINGTLAHRDGRDPSECDRIGEDTPNWDVVKLVRIIARTTQAVSEEGVAGLIFVTGRTESCKPETEQWLRRYVWNTWQGLYLRPVADNRMPAAALKERIYKQFIAPNYQVEGVFENNPNVIAMYRNLGLTVYDVGEEGGAS